MNGNNRSSGNNTARQNCKNRLNTVRALAFAVQETALYLDAYPDSPEALEYYHQIQASYRSAVIDYEKNCAPLTIFGNENPAAWDWAQTPMPWEPESNA